jgi:hypothetical protein
VGRETFRTGGKIQTDIVGNKSSELSPKDIVSKHVTGSVHNLIDNLLGGGLKRASVASCATKKKRKAKLDPVIKRDIT